MKSTTKSKSPFISKFYFFDSLKEVIKRNSDSTDGWLFTNFAHRDKLTDEILHLSPDETATRRWIYIIPVQGEPIKILHRIEKGILDSLPGIEKFYDNLQELDDNLQEFSGKKFSLLFDDVNPEISTVDGGFLYRLHLNKIEYISAKKIIQQYKGVLSPLAIKSHERAASLLYKIIDETWDYISNHFYAQIPLYEKDVELFITDKFKEYSLITDYPPVVAFGSNSGNPHYAIKAETLGKRAEIGDVIQLDIWAKERFCTNQENQLCTDIPIFADISWVGIFDTKIPEQIDQVFQKLVIARDKVFSYLESVSKSNNTTESITGFDLDKLVRESLKESSLEKSIRHRTGHGIDTSCHGSGVNLDSVEFPDSRTIIEGSCFSVEPGVYFDSFGLRTEINIYIHNGEPVISGSYFKNGNYIKSFPQKTLLTIKV